MFTVRLPRRKLAVFRPSGFLGAILRLCGPRARCLSPVEKDCCRGGLIFSQRDVLKRPPLGGLFCALQQRRKETLHVHNGLRGAQGSSRCCCRKRNRTFPTLGRSLGKDRERPNVALAFNELILRVLADQIDFANCEVMALSRRNCD